MALTQCQICKASTGVCTSFVVWHLGRHIFWDSVMIWSKCSQDYFYLNIISAKKWNVSSLHLFIYIFCVMCLEMSNMIHFSSPQSCSCSLLLLDKLERGKSRSLCKLGEFCPSCWKRKGRRKNAFYIFQDAYCNLQVYLSKCVPHPIIFHVYVDELILENLLTPSHTVLHV